ncbi:hypothetical protein HX22_002051 [Salmonella enterica subsp. enterica]|nr:hypothetical protein [Salmonella enterica subsp. enterica serovar Poona]
MASALSVNPMQTTNARGTFYAKSDGLIQGVALDDPAARYALASGTLGSDEIKPLWGGLPVNELVPGASSAPRGSIIKRAASLSQLVGFSVFNQAHNGLTTPQSPVPLLLSNMSVSFYRLGSGMRVPVKASDAVISLASAGISVNQPLVWNFAEDCLDVFSTAAADVATTAITRAEIDLIIQQHADYGLIDATKIDQNRIYIGLCYSIDKPVASKVIEKAMRDNDGHLNRAAHDRRQASVLATNNALTEQENGYLGELEVSAEQRLSATDDRDETAFVDETLAVNTGTKKKK